MTNTIVHGKTYAYDREVYASLQALANQLYYEHAFTGDMSDFEYLMYCIDGITESEAEDICDRIRDLNTEEYGDEDDIEFNYDEELD